MPSSKFLVHWTGQKDIEPYFAASVRPKKYAERLKDWYQRGLCAIKTKEKYVLRLPGNKKGNLNKPKMKHFVRICFTEIRLSQVEAHAVLYGKLGIGFERDFVIRKGGRPVIYAPWEFRSRWMEAGIWEAWEASEGNDQIRKRLKWLFAFFKLMSHGKPGSKDFKDFYEEMEWRLVYGESIDTSGTFTVGDNSPCTHRVEFQPHDVRVVVFPDEQTKVLTLRDPTMQALFAVHQPNLVMLDDCQHF